MTFRTLTLIRTHACVPGLALVLGASFALAQKSPLLQITELVIPPGELLQVSFSDAGTGATNYILESSTTLGDTALWTKVPGSLVLNLGNDHYQAIAPSPTVDLGFYRILAQGGLSGPVTATFATSDLRIVEGSVASPVVTFNAPYSGPLLYSLTGVTGTGEAISQSGEVMVNGTSVTIPIDAMDDDVVGTLTFLTLTIQGMPGVIPGSLSQTLITVAENDAVWKGSLSLDGAELGFSLLIEEVNDAKSARLHGDGAGFFGSLDAPTTLIFSSEVFQSSAQNIPLPPQDSYLNETTELTLSLSAVKGIEGQFVSGSLVKGTGTLISRVLGQPHLDRTNSGTFTLLKPPVSPSASQVNLDPIP